MTIKEEADKILKSRKIWGDIWDEYDLDTLVDIIKGKTQRAWNLLDLLKELPHPSKALDPQGTWKTIRKAIEKGQEELIDIYNYTTKLKERLKDKPIELDEFKCERCGRKYFNAFDSHPSKGWHHICYGCC